MPVNPMIDNLAVALCEKIGGKWIAASEFGEGECDRSNKPQSDVGIESGLTTEDCFATPDMFKLEFSNVTDDSSNQSKKVCSGDFVLSNISVERLTFRYYV